MHKYLIILFFAFLALVSCGDNNDSPDSPKGPVPLARAEKTVLVFMPYTGNEAGGNNAGSGSLYYNLLNNISDMETAIANNKGLGQAHLLVFISQDETTSHLLNIDYKKGKCVRDTLKTYKDSFYTSAEGLTSLLADMKYYAPANNYAMILGCHGEGWIPKYSTTRFFGGMKYQIDIADLAQAINNAGTTMQYILFDDCYMSGIEVAYALRNATHYLIASTSEMMDYGMPYHKIMKYLLDINPDYESLCDEFISFYKTYTKPYGTIAVTNTAYAEEMSRLMLSLNSAYTFDQDNIEKVQDLDVQHFNPTVYFDFGSYVRILCDNNTEAMSSFEQIANKLVPYKAATEKITSYYSWGEWPTVEVKEFSGLTISDPSDNKVAKDTKKQTEWWKATHPTE